MLLHLFTFTFFISWVFLLFFHYETADCLSDDVWKADGLYILNDENFETALHDFSIMFVNFYDPANNRSKLYTHPQMKDAAKMMEDDDIPVAFARMDCNINKEIVSYYNLTRFPTLRLFRFGKLTSLDLYVLLHFHYQSCSFSLSKFILIISSTTTQ